MNSHRQSGRISVKAVVWLTLLLALPAGMAATQNQTASRQVPGAPERVIAVAMPEAAIVAWLLPENPSEAPSITDYTISAYDSDAPRAVAVTSRARAAGAVVHRLTAGHCYSFRVHASNAAGNGAESEPSEAICLAAPGADIQLTMTAPAFASPGSVAAFTMTVTNNGASDAPMVSLVDVLPAPLSSFTTSQGVCQGIVGGSNFGCNLGALQAGASATVTVMVTTGTSDITNTAWASAYTAAGAPFPDPLPSNNVGSAMVSVRPPAENGTGAQP